MRKILPSLLAYLSLIALAVSLFLIVNIISASQHRQQLSHDLAELYNIKYGLFNADIWKIKAADFLSQKIETFSLDTDNRAELQRALEYGLGRMIDELDSFLIKDKESNHWTSKLKGFLSDVALVPENLRAQIPRIAEKVMLELDKEEVKSNIKTYLNKQVAELMNEGDKTVDTRTLDYIQEAYGYDSLEACSKGLSTQITTLQYRLWQYSLWVVFLTLLAFLFWWLGPKISNLHCYVLILLSFVLLAGGISSAMIDIDARISELYFKLLGQEMRFENQIVFFQSKSILDVVYILCFKGDLQTALVGFLILLFSIIFPVAKLLASAIAIPRIQLVKHNPVVKFLVLKSGKWSMADVMVLAIFMAFIGFRGILRSQLGKLEEVEQMDILTTHEFTALQPGFMLFLTFCLASLFLALEMERRVKKLNYKDTTIPA